MPNSMNNAADQLRTLMGLQSPTNVRTVSNRGLDILQGYGDYEPSETELLSAQNELGGTVSRESLREGAMSHIKRQLADSAQRQQFKLQQDAAAHQRDLNKQRLANEGTANVARIGAESKAAQAEAAANAKQAALDTMAGMLGASGRGFSVSGVGSVNNEPSATGTQSQSQSPTDQMMKRLNSARSNFEGFSPLSSAYEWFTGKPSSERTAYGTELESILHRAGSLDSINELMGRLASYPGSLDQKLAAEQASQDENSFDVSSLSPYEREYLKFRIGQ